jgi:hypothetical protein
LLLFVSLTGLAAIAGHVALTRRAAEASWPATALRATSIALEVIGAGLLLIGLVAVFKSLPVNIVLRSLSLGTGIVLLAYGVYFGGRVRGAGFFYQRGRREVDPLLVASLALVGVVVFLSLFWATKDIAQALGRDQARDLEHSLSTQPGAIIFSERRLYLPGASESALGASGYRFRYTGLRLLVRSGGRYFLIPDGWSRTGGIVVVLRDDESVQVEFTRGRGR